jgi:inhibitor of cysteine peptidase
MRGTGTAAFIVVIVVAAALLGVGCQMPGSAKVFRNNQTPLVVEMGQEFAIALESNPTTGFAWQLTSGLDQGLVELVKKEYEAPATDRLGAAGEEKWTFKALEVGRTELTFRYARPWEEEGGEKTEPAEGVGEGHGTPVETSAPAGESGGEEGEESQPPTELSFTVDVIPKGSGGEEPTRYREADSEKALEVALEKQFEVALDSNPTTGYSWRLASFDQDILYLVSQEYEREEKKGGSEEKEGGHGELLGAGGMEVFTFRAVGEGEAEIELQYLRPWETDQPAEKTVTFKVEVKKEVEEKK